MRKLFLMFLVAAVALVGSYTTADAGSVTTKYDDVDITLGGQIRPRFEYSDRTLADGGMANHWFAQRTRLNMGIDAGGVKGFFQLQDVRTWGEELNTLGDYDANYLDVHQAYIDLIDVAGMPFDLRIGRQELAIDGHRIMGTVGWTHQARSWDGIKLSSNIGPASVKLWGFKERERTVMGNGGAAAETPATRDKNVIGGYAKFKPTDASTLSGLFVYRNDDSTAGAGLNDVTMGLRGTLKHMGFNARVEGYYQTGDASSTLDANAFMVGARLGYTFKDMTGKPNITAWYDYVSGDDDPTDGDNEAFNTLYATNHKFYGFMDYFLNVPVNTANLGLQDIAAKFSVSPAAKTKVLVHIHYFMTAEDAANGNKELGQELDLILKYKYSKHLMLVAGYSHFFNEEMSNVGKSATNEDADWSFLMLDFKF